MTNKYLSQPLPQFIEWIRHYFISNYLHGLYPWLIMSLMTFLSKMHTNINHF